MCAKGASTRFFERPPHRFMGRGRTNLPLDHFIGPKPHRPPRMSLRGPQAAQSHEGCLRRAVEEWLRGWTLLLFAVEGCLQSLLHTAFPQACNGMGVHRESASNLLITPGRSIRIRFEEHVGLLDLVCR